MNDSELQSFIDSGCDLSKIPAMKIQLAPGQKLIVGFYDPACNRKDNGWTPPEDHMLDGEFTIEYRDDAIVVSADLPDDTNRGGHHCSESHKPGRPKADPIIYYASHGDEDDSEIVEIEKTMGTSH